MIKQFGQRLLQEKLLIILILFGVWLLLSGHLASSHVFALVEWPTIGGLFGLLILSYGLEQSGYLQQFGRRLIVRHRSQRQIALFFIVVSAVLSAFITNDISLFIIIPLALAVGQRLKSFPTARLVIFIALAVNVGSSLTPVGNPQNLFLWQTAHVSFFQFTRTMVPLVTVLFFVLIGGAFVAFSAETVEPSEMQEVLRLDCRLLVTSLILYPLFLVAFDKGHLVFALPIVVAIYSLCVPRVFRRMDWGLLLIFILMFIDFKSLATLPLVRSWATHALAWHLGAYKSGVLFSQVLSNVPATILLQSYHPSWQRLAWGVGVGGFGFAIGSLANLIALRLARGQTANRGLADHLWVQFHLWSLLMLAISFGMGLLLL